MDDFTIRENQGLALLLQSSADGKNTGTWIFRSATVLSEINTEEETKTYQASR